MTANIEQQLTEEYLRVIQYCEENDVPDYMSVISKEYLDGGWKFYTRLFDSIPNDFTDKVVVDFGCKYGHLLPYLVAKGASKVIGLDAEQEYVEVGKSVFEQVLPDCQCELIEDGLIPLQPNSVDIIFVNEVISHINPAYLDTVFSEWARILKMGGIVFISDGNNAASQLCLKKLLPLYEAWENGPDGRSTDRDYVAKSYLTRRKEIIRELLPDLAEDKVQYVAVNTSGLFGETLKKIILNYGKTGELIERPYRSGTYPTNPRGSGVVMERTFHPLALEKHLFTYGIFAKQILPERQKPEAGDTWVSKFDYYMTEYNYYKKMVEQPDHERGAGEGFKMLGRKVW